MAHREMNETPEMEAKEHSRGFLKRAAEMKGRGKGKRKSRRGKKVRGHKRGGRR